MLTKFPLSTASFLKAMKLSLVLVLFILGMTASQAKTSSEVAEYNLKAVLLVKLTRYVYLADFNEEEKLNICIAGANPFGEALDKLVQKPVGNLDLKLTYITNLDKDSNLISSCDYGFISNQTPHLLDTFLRNFSKAEILTISDIDGFAKKGGMIELALPQAGEKSISILINRQAAEEKNIQFNSQLLRLAKLVS